MAEGLNNVGEEQQDFDSKMTRRKFLRNSATVLGALALGNEERTEAAGEKIDYEAYDTMMFDAQTSRISYRGEYKKITPEVDSINQKMTNFSEYLFSGLGGLGQETNKEHLIAKGFSSEEVINHEEAIWEEASRAFPELKLGQFDTTQFPNLVIVKLPSIMAQYGIFMKCIGMPIATPDKRTLTEWHTVPLLYSISKVETNRTSQWGREIDRDIIYLKGLYRESETLKPIGQSGQTFYQNVIIFEEFLREESGQMLDQDSFDSAKTSLPLAKTRIIQEGDQSKVAMFVALELMVKANNIVSYEDILDKTIEHETTHLLDQTDPLHQSLRPKGYKTFRDFLSHHQNLMAHEEINGLLGELRYSKNKIGSLSSMMTAVGGSQDFGHVFAGQWVLNQMVEKIAANPTKFGIDLGADYSADIQIIVWLPALTDKPELLNRLCEEIMKEYRGSHYQESFTKDGDESVIPEQGQNTPSKLLPFGAIPFLVGGGILGFQAFAKRREIGFIEREIGKRIPRTDAERILEDLQIRNKGLISKNTRERAINRIIKDYHQAEWFTGLFERLDHFGLVGEKNKYYLETLIKNKS